MVIVLAAGVGKRMRSATPKVLHEVLGRSLIGHVLASASHITADRSFVVVGAQADLVSAHIAQIAPHFKPVLQAEQNGTGHAVRLAMAEAPDFDGTVLVLCGDTPLIRAETIGELLQGHETDGAVATLLSGRVDIPDGLGRIIRTAKGEFSHIVEERDATAEQRRIVEINAGIYAFDAATLRRTLSALTTDNAQQEEYLTDVFGLLTAETAAVRVHPVARQEEVLGCNDRAELAELARRLRDRINRDLMRSGVTMKDPETVWIDVTVEVQPDAVIEPNVQLKGRTVVQAGAVIGPDTTLADVTVGEGASVVRTHGTGARIGAGASVGPYAALRPGTELGADGKIGTFVETKNAQIGTGSKVPHLSYVGDASIGEHTNIGAATVFVNYDGVNKSQTVIGNHARTGSDNMFVAPVEVGDGAYTGAGTVVRRNVPPGALSYSHAPQRIVEGWVASRRPGTAAADAASAALANTAGSAAPANTAGPATPEPEEGSESGDAD